MALKPTRPAPSSSTTPPRLAGPRRIVPPASFLARGVVADLAGAPAPLLVNHGGPVLGSVQVVPIYWGAAWGTGATGQLPAQIDAFFDFILTSSLIDMLAEYSTQTTAIGHGQRLASIHIADTEPGTPTSSGRQVTDAQIQSALQGWIAAGTAPPTTANTLYFIYLPPNVTCVAVGGQSCTTFCGYHDQIGGTVYYALIPYADCDGCVFPGDFIDTLTEVSTHELCEAITDPTLSTWWDPNPVGGDPGGDEIGDICNRQTTRLGGFLIQTEWSNQQGACAIAPPGAAAGP